MKRLKIQLIGVKGAGKTTVARMLEKFFAENGFVVSEVEDKDIDKAYHNLDTCVASLKERVAIDIETINSNAINVLNATRKEIDNHIDSTIDSWLRSPDRMGGQYTSEEIEHSTRSW